MFAYPLKQISKQQWNKKVQATLMFSIPAQDQALPVLYEILDVLENLNNKQITQVLDESVQEYFFQQVFPQVCAKIIKSRYFKNDIVLTISNKIMGQCLYLYVKYFQLVSKYSGLNEILTTVLSPDDYYFKTNNQLDYKLYPHYYLPMQSNQLQFINCLQQGDLVDVIKSTSKYDKLIWSRGKILSVNQSFLEIQYLNDADGRVITVDKATNQIAKYKTKSNDFQWRITIKQGDVLDCQDGFGGWYHATVLRIISYQHHKRAAKVTLKVYHPEGNKSDQNGKFYGFLDQQQLVDVTNPKLMPFGSTCKYRNYQSLKSSFETDDSNDMLFQQSQGERIYAFPRKRALSQFFYRQLNIFGRLGGFTKPLNNLQSQINFEILCSYLQAMGNVSVYLHKQIVIQIVQRLMKIVENHIFATSDIVTKEFTKQRSEKLFTGIKTLMKRLYSSDFIYQYENRLKMTLVGQCLGSQALKRKLQGLHQLKDIVRSMSHTSERSQSIKKWIIEQKIFDKIYLQNSHVQLVKKSQDFFKFMITKNMLEVKDLQRLYRIAQKGDYESRVSIYKLLQQMSNDFNQQHVSFLIDSILQSQQNLILNEDIDMLHELSKFSKNYFPKQKVKEFFQKLILTQTKNKQLIDYAIKKYADIVSKGYQMKSLRSQIIRNFLRKINTNDIQKVLKLLKGIFQGLCVGQWGRKDLTDILQEEKVQQLLLHTITQSRNKPEFKKIIHQILKFQLFLIKLSHRIKIRLQIVKKIWQQLKWQQSTKRQYYQWLNKIIQSQQGIQVSEQTQINQLQIFYLQLFPQQRIQNLEMNEFLLAKNLFVQINKKSKLLSINNVMRDKQIEKEYIRRYQFNTMKLIQQMEHIIYHTRSKIIYQKAFGFYLELYSSKDNSPLQINQFLNLLLQKFKVYYKQRDLQRIERTLKLIQMVVNDSQKSQQLSLTSMIKCRKGAFVNITIISDMSYISDLIKKQNLFQRLNISLLQLKQNICKKLSVSMGQMKLTSKYQLSDYYNSYTLSQLGINSQQPLTVSRKIVYNTCQQDIIIDGKMNQKAKRVFKIIYNKYAATQGQMSKQDYNNYTISCLGTFTKNYYDKIAPIYAKYDSRGNGLLSFDDFIRFYTDSALDKPSTVWSNIRNLGVKGNFKFKDQPQDKIPNQDLPRSKLYQNQQFYDILFDLLEEKQISKTIFNFLLRLPANRTMDHQLRNIWSQNTGEKGKQNLQVFLTQNSRFRFLYKLILILNIKQYSQTSDSLWSVKFSINHGYQIPFKFLKTLAKKQSPYTSAQLDIIQLIYQIIQDYVYNAFGTKTSILSSSLFQEDWNIQEKLEYIVTGIVPTNHRFNEKSCSFGYRYVWDDTKQTFNQLFLALLIKMKTQATSQTQSQKKSVYSSLSFKFMSLLASMFINEDQTELLPLYAIFFDQKQSSKVLNEFYTLILCLCFYSQISNQSQHIHQLFKYIKSKQITSDHFRVLAVLVSRFGFKQQNLAQIPQVLLKNILQEQNQPTIQGCARLLCNFQTTQLKSISPSDVQKIFDRCLFGKSITCNKQPSRNQIFQLLIKISQSNKQIAKKVVQKTSSIIQENIPHMKVVYSADVNKKSTYGYAGLKNLGNICYMNSMIQQLYVNKTFRNLLQRINDHKQPQLTFDAKGETVDDNFLHQIQRIMAYLQFTNRQDFAPNAFCTAYKPFGQSVNIMMQQDVQQFVSMFFDRLEQGIKEHPLRNLVQNFYTGKTANLFKCHNCKQTKKIEENFHSISLQVKNSKNLSQSFNRYALGEVINDYRCDLCSQKSDVSKMTRISKSPQILIIHLQRIVFNLDTFINQKITTRHQFPISFNSYPYSLSHYQVQQSNLTHPQNISQYDYELSGIIIHIGNAESGHYISYIKTEEDKWLQFNDSLVSLFSQKNIDAECYGGYGSTFQDDYQWEKKETSKSAYLLIYNRKLQPNIQLIIKAKQLHAQQLILQQLHLQCQIQTKPNQRKNSKTSQQKSQQNQSHDQSSIFNDSQHERQLQKDKYDEDMKELEMIKQKKSDDVQQELKTNFIIQKQKQAKEQLVLKVKNNITPYIAHQLKEQIEKDNRVHFFQTNLASQGFSTFFAKIISMPEIHSGDLIKMCQKLTLGFWLKSKSFKQLLQSLQTYLKSNPQSVPQLVLQNDQFTSLLIQNSNMEIRLNITSFLSNVLINYTSHVNIGSQLQFSSQQNKKIIKFLDRLFDLIPTTVTKCWTKFNQYFQFWANLASNQVFTSYLVKKQVIKHFVDYFLDKKSPLKIYCKIKAQQIGSSYANPQFGMLLRCVSNLLNQYFIHKQKYTLTKDDLTVLIHFQFLQKLISQGYEQIAAKLSKQICPDNPKASQKFAVVLLKGFSKATYQNVQRYIQVLNDFITIQDQYQVLRLEWVLGKATLAINVMTKGLSALAAKNLDQRLYTFDSSLHVENGASFLEPLFQLNKRVQNFCILCAQGVVKICLASQNVRKYIMRLPAPTLIYGKYIDFFQQFINRYIEQSKRSYYSTVTHFNKAQLGLSVKQIYQQLLQLWRIQQKQFIQEEQVIQNNYVEIQKLLETTQQVTQDQNQVDLIDFSDNSFKAVNSGDSKESQFQNYYQINRNQLNITQVTKVTHKVPIVSLNAPKVSKKMNIPYDAMGYQPEQWQEVPIDAYEQNVHNLVGATERPILFTQNERIDSNLQGLNPSRRQNQISAYDYQYEQYEVNDIDSNKNNSHQGKQDSREQDFNEITQIEMKQIKLSNIQQNKQIDLVDYYGEVEMENRIWKENADNNNKDNQNHDNKQTQNNNDNKQTQNNNDNKQTQNNNDNKDTQNNNDNKDTQNRNHNEDNLDKHDNKDNLDNHDNKEGKDANHDNKEDKDANHNDSNKNQNNKDDDSDWTQDHKLKRTNTRNQQGCRRAKRSRVQHYLNAAPTYKQDDLMSQDGEDQPLIKSKQNQQQSKQQQEQATQVKQQSPKPLWPQVYTPVQFAYKPISKLALQKQMFNIQVTYHQSIVTLIPTQPTLKSNKSFPSSFGSKCIFNRIKQECWKNKKTNVIKGYLVVNNSRQYTRVITHKASYLIKPNQAGWIWEHPINRIYKTDRVMDWPDWTIFYS